MEESVELMVMIFPGEKDASEVMRQVRSQQGERGLRWYAIAAVVKDSKGHTRWIENEDVDPARGAIFGAIAGALIGLLGGPAGMVVGAAAGAATGGMAASSVDMGFSREFLSELKEDIQPGTSALMLLAEKAHANRLAAELQNRSGRLLRHVLRAELAQKIRDASKDQ